MGRSLFRPRRSQSLGDGSGLADFGLERPDGRSHVDIFAYQIAGTAPAPTTLTVGTTNTALSFTAASGASWLSVTPTSGTTLTTLSVSVKTAGLTPGTYTSAITITAAGASNSPLAVPVTLVVTAQPAVVAAPSALAFTYQVGGSAPVAQNLAITSTNTPLPSPLRQALPGSAWRPPAVPRRRRWAFR